MMQKEESGFFLGTQVSTAAGDRPAGMLRPAPHPPRLPPPSPLPVSAMLASSALTAPPCLPSPAGGHNPVRRVPGLEGIAHPGQDQPLPGQSVPGGRGPLPGLHHAGGEAGQRAASRRAEPRSRRPAPHRPACRPGLLQLSALVRAAVEDNTLTIEPVASQTLPAVKVAAVEYGSTR